MLNTKNASCRKPEQGGLGIFNEGLSIKPFISYLLIVSELA